MDSNDSVSHWMEQIREGDSQAARMLWERYFHRLVGLARKKLGGNPRRAADEEDVALSAFNSFFKGAEAGRFPELLDRQSLWRLLVIITARKALHQIARDNRQKRGAGAVLDEAAMALKADNSLATVGLQQVLSREPTPEFAAQLAEQWRLRMDWLEDPELRSVAEWKLEGYTNLEIAAKLTCSERSVERKIQTIRALWSQDSQVS
jgi:DNA-directed RNA polymerase specialized sigma24 family protein